MISCKGIVKLNLSAHQEINKKRLKVELSTAHRGSKKELKTTTTTMVEAMKKLDAKLVAYLAAEDDQFDVDKGKAANALPTSTSTQTLSMNSTQTLTNTTTTTSASKLQKNDIERSNKCTPATSAAAAASASALNFHAPTPTLSSLSSSTSLSFEAHDNNLLGVQKNSWNNKLDLFKSICAIKLHLEALNLELEGEKRIELFDKDIRPIFTIECQLSIELIRHVPRYDMFHIMQFESQIYEPATQRIIFAKESAQQRDVKLVIDVNDNDIQCDDDKLNIVDKPKPNFGRIHFAVWQREPGTCLNEMLGTGVFELYEFFNNEYSLHEKQCKYIKINRRGMHLATININIELLLTAEQQQKQQQQQQSVNQEQEQINNELKTEQMKIEIKMEEHEVEMEVKEVEKQQPHCDQMSVVTDNKNCAMKILNGDITTTDDVNGVVLACDVEATNNVIDNDVEKQKQKQIQIQKQKQKNATFYQQMNDIGIGENCKPQNINATSYAKQNNTSSNSNNNNNNNNNNTNHKNKKFNHNNNNNKNSSSSSNTNITSNINNNNKNNITNSNTVNNTNNNNTCNKRGNHHKQLVMSAERTETSNVRLLKGFLYVNETRILQSLNENCDYFLVCRQFWQNDAVVSVLLDDNKQFNFQQEFTFVNDEKILKRVEQQFLQLEIWQHTKTPIVESETDNGNNAAATPTPRMRAVGLVRLPLHHFYVAYSVATLANRLALSKRPVISIDAWASIECCDTQTTQQQQQQLTGEIKCLLAIGSTEQIDKLKATRNFHATTTATAINAIDTTLFTPQPILATTTKTNNATTKYSFIGTNAAPKRAAADLMHMIDKRATAATATTATTTSQTTTYQIATPTTQTKNPQQQEDQSCYCKTANKSFKFLLDIQRAINLPLNPAIGKGHKKGNSGSGGGSAGGSSGGSGGGGGGVNAKRNNTHTISKRFPPNEAPSAYVTFQAFAADGQIYKSHEGAVYATNVIEKSTAPLWQQRFHVVASTDYLLNAQQHFILKVWKRAACNNTTAAAAAATTTTATTTQNRLQPAPLDDAIIGFAALDLSVFLRNLHIGGLFNIVDFNGRINGKLEVHSQPLEDVQKLLLMPTAANEAVATPTTTATDTTAATATTSTLTMDAVIDQFEHSFELEHLNLGQAIKRKFTELEGISQNLRTRLVGVTGQELSKKFDMTKLDNWKATNVVNDNKIVVDDDYDDEFDVEMLEFERDINTQPPAMQQQQQNQQQQQQQQTATQTTTQTATQTATENATSSATTSSNENVDNARNNVAAADIPKE